MLDKAFYWYGSGTKWDFKVIFNLYAALIFKGLEITAQV